jgi:hypothetical protein
MAKVRYFEVMSDKYSVAKIHQIIYNNSRPNSDSKGNNNNIVSVISQVFGITHLYMSYSLTSSSRFLNCFGENIIIIILQLFFKLSYFAGDSDMGGLIQVTNYFS